MYKPPTVKKGTVTAATPSHLQFSSILTNGRKTPVRVKFLVESGLKRM
jgi:hypothetical protein